MRSDRFGINMKQFCREHEARVTAAVAAGEATEELLEEHPGRQGTVLCLDIGRLLW